MCSGHSLSGLVSTSSFLDCCSIYMHFASSAQCPCRSHFLMLAILDQEVAVWGYQGWHKSWWVVWQAQVCLRFHLSSREARIGREVRWLMQVTYCCWQTILSFFFYCYADHFYSVTKLRVGVGVGLWVTIEHRHYTCIFRIHKLPT
jgi:hypothetical protein